MIPILDLSHEIESIRADIDTAIAKVIGNSNFIMGEEVRRFEAAAAEYLGVKHAIGVNSGTDALVIALRAMGIGEAAGGSSTDEVITSPFSFFATAESISINGAKPVFVDIDERTYNLDPDLIEAAITPNTKAIMPVHLYGRSCNMGRITEIARKHKLKVIEDCAQSFGASYRANCEGCSCDEATKESLRTSKTGAMGDAGCYSFFPSKNLGAFGDGGMVVTNDDELADQMRMLRVHGAKKKYHNEVLGFNSRLDTIQAAVLLTKLPHIDRWNNGRLAAAGIYNMLIEQAGLDKELITLPEAKSGDVFHQYTIRIDLKKAGKTRDQIQQELKDKGIGSMVYYPVPQDQLPVYAGQYKPGSCPVSDQLSGEVLSLPIWPLITMASQEEVVEKLEEVLR